MAARDLAYYATVDKVHWYPLEDNPPHWKKNDPVPCLFVESTPGRPDEKRIIDIDHSIEHDGYRYTAWRRLLGEVYGVRMDVYLIVGGRLFNPDGAPSGVDFGALGRSEIMVSKDFMAKVGIKRNGPI